MGCALLVNELFQGERQGVTTDKRPSCKGCGVASSQPTPTIINPPAISAVATIKIAVSNGVIIQFLRMVHLMSDEI
jgi:hypothetical protein